jgi:hypothetical protein
MKKKNAKRNTQYAKQNNFRVSYHVSRITNLNQLGVAPLVFLAISGLFLAFVLILIATQSFMPKNPLSTPAPSGTTIGGVVIASPIPVDPNDPALCDDEYNAYLLCQYILFS